MSDLASEFGCGYRATDYQMIHGIEIRNFRCFEHLKVDDCRRINVLVGENGAGKTAFMEALFLALSGNAEVSTRLRQQRGLEAAFTGSISGIEEGIWRDYFYNFDWTRRISVILRGSGPEARSLHMFRGQSQLDIDLTTKSEASATLTAPLTFVWRDAQGHEHTYSPRITTTGVQIPGSVENLPNFFFFAASQNVSPGENAQKFSEMSKARNERKFVKLFRELYDWIEDLNIEVVAGLPVIHASVKNLPIKIPINLVSGGVTRILGIMLTLAAYPRSVIMIDEIENGIYFKQKKKVLQGLLALAAAQDCQLFLSTHDEELLESMVQAAGKNIDDIMLWRLERHPKERIVRSFPGKVFKAGIETGGEVR